MITEADAEEGGCYLATLDGKDWETMPERPVSALWNSFWLRSSSKSEYRQAWVEAREYNKTIIDKYRDAGIAGSRARARIE